MQTPHTIFPASCIWYLLSDQLPDLGSSADGVADLSALLPCIALLINIANGNTQGDFYLFFGASIITILSRSDLTTLWGSMMSTLGHALGFFLLATTLFPDLCSPSMIVGHRACICLAGPAHRSSLARLGDPWSTENPRGAAPVPWFFVVARLRCSWTYRQDDCPAFLGLLRMFSAALLLLSLAILLLGRIFGISNHDDMRYTRWF